MSSYRGSPRWQSNSRQTPQRASDIPSESESNSSSPNTLRNAMQSHSQASTPTGHRRQGSAVASKFMATFAPTFIQSHTGNVSGNAVKHGEGLEGTDFSGKRWVWVKDQTLAFVKGFVDREEEGNMLRVICDDGTERVVHADNVDRVNPAKFEKAADMAELTHLNEASVVHNLHMRYQSDLIYTYSGLFLVTVNPYCSLPIYTNEYVEKYKNRSREENQPHIFAISDAAFRNLLQGRENQSILVTGESGAGKTENTKKVIQYLASVALDHNSSKTLGTLEQQILQANPILEAFGNAQTVRNNNSSRFGKFIRIEFTRMGQIAGAFIDWYLLEKSRVVQQGSSERNYHIFYQLLRGASRDIREKFLLTGNVEDYAYTKSSNHSIVGVNDAEEFRLLMDAFHIMKFSLEEQSSQLQTIAAVLHLGNLGVISDRGDGARLTDMHQAERICHVLGIPVDAFVKGLLNPRVKAGREWVNQSRNMNQVKQSVDALSKGIYERGFGSLVSRINQSLERRGEESGFIGVLDIAGFEIFESNSFEQLCINYTNEKLQQFFNHHMFVLEQEEYARERIEWKFIDFGHDLQPTINLIELSNPIGIFSCLDEDCVMPKASDKSFTEKLHSLWDKKSPKYKSSLLSQGFVLTHYAAEVEYSTEGWLEKNKDPLNDNITRLLAKSHHSHIADLFADCAEDVEAVQTTKSRVKKGLFRTVAQRHKEQLSSLMNQLHATHPHFVRCIIPNHQKRPKRLNTQLVLDQLRCNGVLEGIRIARTGFPNRLLFSDFRHRYEVLTPKLPRGYLEGAQAATLMLQKLDMDPSQYRIGLTKVFFRAGVLADLEEQRDALVRSIIVRFQGIGRGYIQRRLANKKLFRAEATRILHKNLQVYLDMCENPWWKLFVKTKPLLGGTITTSEIRKKDELISKLEAQMQQNSSDRAKLEDDRRRTDSELMRVQQTLEAERALALDKDEIFKRLQQREQDLEEKLSGALDDQDALEDQIDELVALKKNVSDQANAWRTELEQACALVMKLEEDKKALQSRVDELEKKLRHADSQLNSTSNQEATFHKEISLLKSHLSMKDRKINDYEALLAKTDGDLEAKLQKANREIEQLHRSSRTLEKENAHAREQLHTLTSTSTDYENVVRRKESELAIIRSDLSKIQLEKKTFLDEKASLIRKQDEIMSKLRSAEKDVNTAQSQNSMFEREVQDAKRLLEVKVNEDAKLGEGRKLLDEQIKDLRRQLSSVQDELRKEQQARGDALAVTEQQLDSLKRDHDALQIAKVTIEKELYGQQDTLRRALEARSQAEKEKKDIEADLKTLKERVAVSEGARAHAEATAERQLSRQTNEMKASLKKELEMKDKLLKEAEYERNILTDKIKEVAQAIDDSERSRKTNEQARARVEQEIGTLRARLLSSENDNRSLQNKIQQKNLELAKSNSKASEQYRAKIVALTTDKAKAEEEERRLKKSINDAQINITSLEKQKEKLALNLEDLNHEVAREHKVSRAAEKQNSIIQAQLAEVNRSLETEKQLKVQSQTNNRKLQGSLDSVNSELNECHQQLLVLQQVFDHESDAPKSFEAGRPNLIKSVDLAQKLENSRQQLKIAEERRLRADEQVTVLRKRHQDEIQELEARHIGSRKALLDEMNDNPVPPYGSQRVKGASFDRMGMASPKTPTRRALNTAMFESPSSAKTDRTVDTINYQRNMDAAAELEMKDTQLQILEMQNKHLQNLLDLQPNQHDGATDENPSVRHLQRLERENDRLHDKLDDETGKNSALEAAMRTTELSMRDVHTRSHEELIELIGSQEKARMALLQYHHATVADLTSAKSQIEKIKVAKNSLDLEIRDLKSELEEVHAAREQEQSSRTQLLEENADLQIRLDAEVSHVNELTSNASLYKQRSEEYYSKLEQAEIAVFRATRAENFAKEQNKEAQDTCATVLAERRQVESIVEDLQRQNQKYEEKVEDLSADLSDALQAKKRLQHELEDYRNRRAVDLEDKETSIDQTKKMYQSEMSQLSRELEIERETSVKVRSEFQRLRDEIEDVRAKWDDEILNSNTSAKEKSRLEIKLADLSQSHQEAVAAHNDAQGRIVALLSQNRSLRNSMDEAVAEKESLQKDKRTLEQRLADASQRLEDLSNGESPSLRDAAGINREILDLKALLAQQEDITSAAVGKMRRAEVLVSESQKDISKEREVNVQLHLEKSNLEKSLRELQHKVVDLETQSYSSGSKDVRLLHSRIRELEDEMEQQEAEKNKTERATRNIDRTVRDMQAQIDRRDKINTQLEDDIVKGKEKIERLLSTIDELQSSDSSNQLLARRAEREVREEREKCLRLERELESLKALRLERNNVGRSITMRTTSDFGESEGHTRRSMSRGHETKTFI